MRCELKWSVPILTVIPMPHNPLHRPNDRQCVPAVRAVQGDREIVSQRIASWPTIDNVDILCVIEKDPAGDFIISMKHNCIDRDP